MHGVIEKLPALLLSVVIASMKQFRFLLFLFLALPIANPGFCAPPLQLFIALTPPGQVLRPPPGIYSGPVVITRPITIDGGGKVTLDAGGEGTVLRIEAPDTTIRGLHITRSGESHDQLNAGIQIDADDALIEDNTIDQVLFGIIINRASGNVIRNNRISSLDTSVSMRGEGVRLWYSSENLIEGNEIHRVRDLMFINSPDNRVIGNNISHGRMGMELVFSPGNEISGNHITGNITGIVGIYSDELVIRDNKLMHMRHAAGSALAIKESSQVLIEDNEILHCAVGLIVNSPVHPENILYLKGNRLAYNDVALYFYGEKGGHVIQGNRFESNLLQVAVTSYTSALDNDWTGNYWDDYEGFDLDLDGIGDTPHSVYIYADRIWMDRPVTRFFRSSPVLEMIDFVERLAPFSPPDMILSDPQPRFE